MLSLALLSQKGGSGKTTLAVHLAVIAMAEGRRVAIVDTDPQRSATVWSRARRGQEPVVATATPGNLDRVFEAARVDGIDFLLVDSAPHAAAEAAQVAAAVQAILIPCRPSAFDLAAVGAALDIASAANVPVAVVLNACPPRAPETHEAQQVLAAQGAAVAPCVITERRAFSRAVATGRAVSEFEPSGQAAQEVKDLWRWLRANLLTEEAP